MYSGNPRHVQQQVSDEPMIEQLYHFDQYRNGVSAVSTTSSM